MAHGSRRNRSTSSTSRKARSFGFDAGGKRDSQAFLLTATDVCLWMTFVGVTVCFGGRAAAGQLILVVGAALTAGCWLLRQLTAREPRRMWTGSEWLWLLPALPLGRAHRVTVGLFRLTPWHLVPPGLLSLSVILILIAAGFW